MTPEGLFGWLANAPCGAFAVALDQTIVYWNEGAQDILGHSAGRVVGLKCYDVMRGLADPGLTPDCVGGCACIRYARVGMVPVPMELTMRCSSGVRKVLQVQPVVVAGVDASGPLVVYLFGDGEEQAAVPEYPRADRLSGYSPGPLTARELQVLHYLGWGWEVHRIAEELGLSAHTVRNHSSSLRRKLYVQTSLEAVMVALRTGLLALEDLAPGLPEAGSTGGR